MDEDAPVVIGGDGSLTGADLFRQGQNYSPIVTSAARSHRRLPPGTPS